MLTVRQVGSVADCVVLEFFDVKFYPFDPLGTDPIFAAVSKKHVCGHLHLYRELHSRDSFTEAIRQVLICRLVQGTESTNPCEVLRVIRDDDVGLTMSARRRHFDY